MTATTRRSHAERSATTRAALLDATLDCLAELGYSGTTTVEVVKRAGVSRGAQVHHFPTKAGLISAALARLLAVQRQRFADEFAALPPHERTEEAGLRLLWSVFDGKSYRALMQLAVASFADPELKAAVAEVFRALERTVVEGYAEHFPVPARRDGAERDLLFAFRAMESAALYRELGLDTEAEHMVAVLGTLTELRDLAIGLGLDTAAASRRRRPEPSTG